ncbi:hypothetical protein DJ030_00060, partial [bacterium endosymbiont of Escarpia laminata]
GSFAAAVVGVAASREVAMTWTERRRGALLCNVRYVLRAHAQKLRKNSERKDIKISINERLNAKMNRCVRLVRDQVYCGVLIIEKFDVKVTFDNERANVNVEFFSWQ